jgi:hypothetical protein
MSGSLGNKESMFSWKRMTMLLVGLFVVHSCFVYLWPVNLPAPVAGLQTPTPPTVPANAVKNYGNTKPPPEDPLESHDFSSGLISEGNHNIPGNSPSSDANKDTSSNANGDATHENQHEVILSPEHTNNDSLPTFPEPGLAPQLHIPLDAHNQIIDSLTMDQCSQAFPGLFEDLDRAAKYWNMRMHKITAEDVDIKWRTDKKHDGPGGAMRILIHDNQIRIVESRGAAALGYWDRGVGLLRIIERALESASRAGEILPTIEAAIVLQDVSDPPTEDGTNTFWTFTRRNEHEPHRRLWVTPNWDLQGWYHERKRTAIAMDKPFKDKIPKLIWRGTQFWNAEIRNTLVDLAKGKPWADVLGVDGGHTENRIGEDKFCEYAMNVHTEGVSYSDRLEYLLNCNSLTFVHELNWTVHFSHLLKGSGPEQNVVMVKRDFSDLEEKVNYYLNHPDEAEKIIANSVRDFRRNYLSRAATSCYTRRLISRYSEVSYTPEVNLPSNPGHADRRRGLAFEDFVSLAQDVIDESKEPFDYKFKPEEKADKSEEKDKDA